MLNGPSRERALMLSELFYELHTVFHGREVTPTPSDLDIRNMAAIVDRVEGGFGEVRALLLFVFTTKRGEWAARELHGEVRAFGRLLDKIRSDRDSHMVDEAKASIERRPQRSAENFGNTVRPDQLADGGKGILHKRQPDYRNRLDGLREILADCPSEAETAAVAKAKYDKRQAARQARIDAIKANRRNDL